MKNLLAALIVALAMISPPSAAAGLTEEQIAQASREYLAETDWARDADIIVKRGVGRGIGVLSNWIVVVSCIACDISAPDSEKFIVIGFNQKGEILCVAKVGPTTCSPDYRRGGVTSQSIVVRDAMGNKIEVLESYQSGGGRSMSVAFWKSRGPKQG
jgi:hypothetical protein